MRPFNRHLYPGLDIIFGSMGSRLDKSVSSSGNFGVGEASQASRDDRDMKVSSPTCDQGELLMRSFLAPGGENALATVAYA